MGALPQHQRFIGPIVWSPACELPAWWDRLRTDRPTAYLTPGSSGSDRIIDLLAGVLLQQGYQVVASMAGQGRPAIRSPDFFSTDYLPGDKAAEVADLVVCNGGSPTCYQALAAGKPILGIPSNLDQHLNMDRITAAGAGLMLRSDSLTPEGASGAIRSLADPAYRQRCRELAGMIAGIDIAERFAALTASEPE
jgi:UDP:flavonoid glycosyltransferase YjiC (YdhE family)